MRKEKKNTRKNEFKVRIYDDDVLTSIDELLGTKDFSSTNDLLNQAVERGINEIYQAYGKAKKLSAPLDINTDGNTHTHMRDIKNKLSRIALTIDDLFVLLSTNEALLSTVFNVVMAHENGEIVSEESIEQGGYSDLPQFIKTVREKIILGLERTKEKEQTKSNE